jgi:hypothetical protein
VAVVAQRPRAGVTPAGAHGPAAVVACHGGAGASTLVRMLAPDPALDLALVRHWADFRRRWHLYPLVLVTRGTAAGAGAAVSAVAAAGAAGARPAVLAVVGDGPWPQPAAARARLRLLGPRVGAVVRIPYVTRWRYLDDPLDDGPLPDRVAAAVAAVRAGLTA